VNLVIVHKLSRESQKQPRMGLNVSSHRCKPMVENLDFCNYEVVEHLKIAILKS
jgi:hypothetical protein